MQKINGEIELLDLDVALDDEAAELFELDALNGWDLDRLKERDADLG